MIKKKSAQSSIVKLQETISELETNWKRALADYQNLELRTKKQHQQIIQLSTASLIDKLLPILDDLNRAVKHRPQDQAVKLIRNQFHDILTSEGLSEIEAKGENFNPNTMDCVEITPGPKNQVTKVILPGYYLRKQVIRPVRVEVGSGKKEVNSKQ